ncbi:hypothetical protein G7Y89_g12606 [Cudoniella acicularis]|uniref:Uncharacterized protein n=1 Tax=Cudoniella acicularis TaxID=354080 RepID=A0A8H4VZ03_9HELO|nr:hypothetical protein G7Y89_g12606 [Cudoniella acicularis]
MFPFQSNLSEPPKSARPETQYPPRPENSPQGNGPQPASSPQRQNIDPALDRQQSPGWPSLYNHPAYVRIANSYTRNQKMSSPNQECHNPHTSNSVLATPSSVDWHRKYSTPVPSSPAASSPAASSSRRVSLTEHHILIDDEPLVEDGFARHASLPEHHTPLSEGPVLTDEDGRHASLLTLHTPLKDASILEDGAGCTQKDSQQSHSQTSSANDASPPSQSFELDPNLEMSRAEFEAATSQGRRESREPSEFGDFLGPREDSEGYISDADSEYLDYIDEMEKLKENVLSLKTTNGQIENIQTMQDVSPPRRRGRPRGGRKTRGRGGWSGPRRAAEPTPDIKLRLGQASQLFIEEKYKEAKAIVSDVVRINAETHEAWTLLASIFKEEGNMDMAVYALMFAAHMRPKHLSGWFACARLALEETGEHRDQYLLSAQFCYAAAIRMQHSNLEAHFGKAEVYHEQGKFERAAAEYKTILKLNPHNIQALRKLAEVCIDGDIVSLAQESYRESIAYFKSTASGVGMAFGWSDADAFIELLTYAGQHEQALIELKKLARWLLGREQEKFWDEITVNDCEWDIDDSRRRTAPGFAAGKFPVTSYGAGLPLEFRIKLGLSRLHLGHHEEAMHHFEWHDPFSKSGKKSVCGNTYLCRQVAEHLHEAGLFQQALTFYQSLKEIPEENSDLLQIQMAKCFLAQHLEQEAEKCFLEAIELNSFDTDARTHLAKLYENQGESQKAFNLVVETMALKKQQNPPIPEKRAKRQAEAGNISLHKTDPVPTRERAIAIMPRLPMLRKPARLMNGDAVDPHSKTIHLQTQYYTLGKARDGMRKGDAESTRVWMNAARDLTDDFRSVRTLYPWDKVGCFKGYSEVERSEAQALDSDLTEMSERLSQSLGSNKQQQTVLECSPGIPTGYRGIPFQTWLDIFLEYAICLAKNDRSQQAYDICEAAKDAIVFNHSKEHMFMIHMFCALISNDEETVVAMARFYMKEYQFTTDSYRIFSALTRVVKSPVSWYSSGPTQKFMLRQIRAMDYALVDEATREEKHFQEKGSYSVRDENGKQIVNVDLDISLLMLHGYILYTGASYSYALNYFLRAYALDPNHPIINLSIGLTYIHYGLKRQTENRQYSTIQGLTFMLWYHDIRKKSDHIEERIEADYNLARAYHMLGLVHLANPLYWKVLNGSKRGVKEDLVLEAAYNLQTIYAQSGNMELAQHITKEWLVI